jgi:hypothetical protein
MPFSEFLIILIGVVLQMLMGLSFASPWLIPDLSLISMVFAMARSGDYTLRPAFFLLVLASATTFNAPSWIGLSYLFAGFLVRYVASHWDFSNVLIRLVSFASIECILVIFWVLSEDLSGIGIIFSSIARVSISLLCFHILSPFVISSFQMSSSSSESFSG